MIDRTLVVALVVALAAAGCSKSSDSQTASATATDAGGAASQTVVAGTNAGNAGDATHGQAVFSSNCASCHGVAGAGGGIGPSLKGEKSRKNLGAAIAWIENPQPPMPKLYPSPLGDKDVADVAAYVESL